LASKAASYAAQHAGEGDAAPPNMKLRHSIRPDSESPQYSCGDAACAGGASSTAAAAATRKIRRGTLRDDDDDDAMMGSQLVCSRRFGGYVICLVITPCHISIYL
jgi:hypothetical protein